MYEKQIRLVSDGTLHGTHLYHLPSGTELTFCKLSFDIDAARWGQGELQMTLVLPRALVELDITGPATVVPDPSIESAARLAALSQWLEREDEAIVYMPDGEGV